MSIKNQGAVSSIFCILLYLVAGSYSELSAQKKPPYKNPDLSIEERVQDLLSRMTIEEKTAQMLAVNNEVKDSILITGKKTDIDKIKPLLPHGIGQITRPSETKGGKSQTMTSDAEGMTAYENALLSNKLQKYFIEETRLGIPAIFHEECLHGLVARDATSFPHPIALAGTFDTDFVQSVYGQIAEETRKRGAHQALTPVVDIARDPRWGRVEETYGEDPYLTSQMGIAAIRGFQGDGKFNDKKHIVATLKHFAAHGQPTGGTNTAPANYSERVLREVHFYPFKEVIQKAGALSVMTTYHEIDGVPINANRWLVNDVLREEWGFKGFVVSDYFSIREMQARYGIETHRVARDEKEAALLALNAGVNIELPMPDCYKTIPELVKAGQVSEERIDELVAEMLRVKFELGLFDDPYIDAKAAKDFDGNKPEHKQMAREAALKSIVMLENKTGEAPLNFDDIKRIAVIGPNADREMVGGYTGDQPYHVTVLEGIKNKVGDKIDVKYAEGCRITIGGSWVEDKVVFPDPAEEKVKIQEAVKVAEQSDVVVLVVGGNEQTAREAWNIYHMGDRASLELVGMQNELIDAIHATGKPIVGVVFSGRPLSYNNLIEKSNSLFHCWYLGQESGNAVADVLFGDYNPGAKLPISFPRSVGHLPVYYNHKPSERRGYFNADITPLYPFGYGKSYTTFEISEPKLSKTEISKDESVEVSVTVTNTGKVKGDEVVQLYIRDEFSSVTRRVKELKDFKRVTLAPGETKNIKLQITPEKLSFYDINMDYVVESGEFTIMVGNSSSSSDLKKTTLTVK